MNIQFAAPCLFGLEAPLAEELRAFGAEDVAAENGRVLFSGDENMLARANIRSRYAERISVVIGSFEAHTFDQLFEHTKLYGWERWIGKNDAFPVKGYSLNSDLHSVSDCQAIIKKAIVEALKSKYRVSWFEETGPTYQVSFSILKNRVTLMLDASGVGLHKRGYRPASNAAPIKETLAAALCSFARLRGYHTLYDPMCGSGTIAIEGALLANNVAPGKARSFAAEKWPQVPRRIWIDERDAAVADEKPSAEFRCFASDIDSRSVDLASGNARRAGMDRYITFSKADIRDFRPQTEKGTLIVNPPYGERLADEATARELTRVMGKLFDRRPGWSYNIITADEDFEKVFGRKADKRRKLYNGMIKCQYYMYFK
ncbi:MAG: class I SAM-dependent RNA methyltransferase [Clostridia bacterium]|nr:class I SAM-dependent RNA methyltransferase [Clostridia bacterium]